MPAAAPTTEFTGTQGMPLESNLIIEMQKTAEGKYQYTMTSTQEGNYSLAGIQFVNGVITTDAPIQMTHYASAAAVYRNGTQCAVLDYIDYPSTSGIVWKGRFICMTDTAPTPASDAPAPTEAPVAAVSAPVIDPNSYVVTQTSPFEVSYQKGTEAPVNISYQDPASCGGAQVVGEGGIVLGDFTATLRLGDNAVQIMDKYGVNVANLGTSTEKPCFIMTVNGMSWTVGK